MELEKDESDEDEDMDDDGADAPCTARHVHQSNLGLQ